MTASLSYGAPAAGIPFPAEMEDSSLRQARTRGDEFFNWIEDEEGFAMVRGESGRWQYARREKGRWVPAGMDRAQRGQEGLKADPPPRRADPAESAGALPAAGTGTVLASGSGATASGTLAAALPGPVPLLVLQIAFANRASTYSSPEWASAVFDPTGKTVSAYFSEASNGRFTYQPAAETQGTVNDGVISVTLNINHPNTTSWSDTLRTAVTNALTAANAYIDYQAFDKNGSGYLGSDELQLVLVYAGFEAAYMSPITPYIWAHSWSLYGTVPAPRLDGVFVGSWPASYVAIGEIHRDSSASSHRASIGVICHELGHTLGWIDLYDGDGSSDGVGTHCLMGTGGWGKAKTDSFRGQTPVLPCAYHRQMSLFSDVREAAGYGLDYVLNEVSDSASSNDILRIRTANSNQYFLVENRRLTGFDTGLFYEFGVTNGGGLAIWHIDESAANNNNDSLRRVDLEEAGGATLNVYGGNQGNVTNYFYAGNKTLFNATTSPNSQLNGGAASLASVSNVSASAAQMTFSASAGAVPLVRLSPLTLNLSFAWQGGSGVAAFHNSGSAPLVWHTAPVSWCPASPTNGTLTAGATQQVAVACSTNWVRQVAREGLMVILAAGTNGLSAIGSPFALPLTQAARPPNPATVLSVR